ncbi:MAG: trypsin-like peptidase domain-containing protein [Planctomycetes bacterium]|nr:trypsin-like peptidase domain-containing protein [Planctomycetota bacterium]
MFKNMVAAAEPAVVVVRCADLGSKGSGFLASPSGHVVTNNHVVAEITLQQGGLTAAYSSAITVAIGGTTYPATLVIDPSDVRPVVYDYAILQVAGAPIASYLQLADPTTLGRGDAVLCLGFPLDFDALIVTSGVVSAVVQRPSHVNALHQMRTIVSDALLQFGSSGGPMIEATSGRVVGINTIRHELVDPLAHRLGVWCQHPSAAAFPLVRDLVEYTLKYTYVGLNHAVSVEYVRQDPAWPAPAGGIP